EKNSVDISVEDGVLRIDGRLDFSKCQGLQPLYTEYNVGHYSRSCRLPSRIDQSTSSPEFFLTASATNLGLTKMPNLLPPSPMVVCPPRSTQRRNRASVLLAVST